MPRHLPGNCRSQVVDCRLPGREGRGRPRKAGVRVRRSLFSRSAIFLLQPAILLAPGCGLADYEKKMAQAEARLQRFEDESRVLDVPLSVPLRPPREPGGKPTAFNLFLRP